MKIKKILGVLFTSMLLLTMSSSVFAADVTPNAVGIGDSRTNAITLLDNTMYTLFISDANDKDWYKWTNNTGKDRYVSATLYPTAPGTSLNLSAIIDYGGGIETSVLHGERSVPTNGMRFRNLYVPNGASLYVIIGNDLSTLTQYDFNILSGSVN
ncbi:hypothetical protein [Paenibacillus macerans]|uniref:hypothetical protein n=1 Tax=Paenibacillus macerans TaxID=44252 RepID=UPI003D316B81